MKNITVILMIAYVLSGCALMDYLPVAPSPLPPAATTTATVFKTPTKKPSITPTLPTPTFTLTPTMIYPNGHPAPSLTPSAPATLWMLGTPTDVPATVAAQPLLGNGPFSTILMSGTKLYWGKCDPSSLKVTVKVADGVPAHSVLIFLRLQDPTTKDTTQWGGGAIMERLGGGVFTYDLTAKSFEHYHDYLRAWGQYQFVALDSSLQRIGASTQYLTNLTIEPCP
ncbi:MAG TPA: hypothetical protein VMJ64_17260 [Anaerolineales bacterium]|nr:hypothetical protein [Anaerolineales bacterium]